MNQLDSLGVTVELDKVDPDSTTCKYIGKEVVIWQSLAMGSKVKKGDSIQLKILNNVNFPNWEGNTQDTVTEWCNQNCVTLTVEYQETTDQKLIDKVISQSRPADSKVNNSDSVTIVLGKIAENIESEKEEDEEKEKEPVEEKEKNTEEKQNTTN